MWHFIYISHCFITTHVSTVCVESVLSFPVYFIHQHRVFNCYVCGLAVRQCVKSDPWGTTVTYYTY